MPIGIQVHATPGPAPRTFLDYMKRCKGDPRDYAAAAPLIQMHWYAENRTLELRTDNSLKVEGPRDFFSLLELYITTRVFSGGPKIFRPTAEQLKLLAEMQLNIPFSEYAQPFETMVIELPQDFCDTHVIPNPEDCRKYIDSPTTRPVLSVLHLERGTLVHSVCTDVFTSMKSWYHPPATGELEEWMTAVYTDDCTPEEQDMESLVRRCALAYALLLDETGVKKLGPAQPGRYEAWRRTAEKRNEHSASARSQMRVHPIVYELDQKVELYRTVEHEHELGEPTGRTVTPHWRRGHWRMVACGPKHSLRRKVRIPHVFVNRHLFVGSMADAKATYEAKERM